MYRQEIILSNDVSFIRLVHIVCDSRPKRQYLMNTPRFVRVCVCKIRTNSSHPLFLLSSVSFYIFSINLQCINILVKLCECNLNYFSDICLCCSCADPGDRYPSLLRPRRVLPNEALCMHRARRRRARPRRPPSG